MSEGANYSYDVPNKGFVERAKSADSAPAPTPTAIAYTPTTAADWPVQPTNVKDALDKLAARLNILEP